VAQHGRHDSRASDAELRLASLARQFLTVLLRCVLSEFIAVFQYVHELLFARFFIKRTLGALGWNAQAR
jgi:hypothetical protein